MIASAARSGQTRSQSPSPLPSGPGGSPADDDRDILAETERALAERPSLSIVLRISLSMLMCFLLVASVILASMVLVSRVGTLQEIIDRVSTYALEVEHARRYEKNYLLYGTGLEDAIAQVQAAHNQLRSSSASLRDLIGTRAFAKMEDNLVTYGRFLERLLVFRRSHPTDAAEGQRTEMEVDIRRHGAQVVADATDLIDRERLHLRTAIRTSWIVAASSLLFIMLAMVLVTYALARQVGKPLQRFVGYTQRIANGDFSPILPARRYRDEFSHLAVGINRMLFRLKEREAQLARTSRMVAVGTLTAGIAHELNNPLNNIGLNAEALHDGRNAYTADQKQKLLAEIVGQVERASATVRNLLDFTRVEKPVMVSLSLPKVVEEARRLVANEAAIKHVEFRVEMSANLPPVQGNPRDLHQVFLNLFLNAIQAMPEGGLIVVRGKATESGAIEVEVVDTGVGIPEEDIDSVFDPFFTTKQVGAGTGLGLFVSLGIMEKHGGGITVRSRPGQGTTFTLRLLSAGHGAVEPDARKES